jgi:ligand-binding sensor domain-containing protein
MLAYSLRILIAALFVVYVIAGYAQDFSYKQFTTADGLSSNVVYSAFQDDKGYIWFCTNAGVSRFDGIRFQNYTVKDGLSDNEVFHAVQTRSGKILFITFNTKACYYDGQAFHNEKTDAWLKPSFPATVTLNEDEEGNLWTCDRGNPEIIYVFSEKRRSIQKLSALVKDSIIVVGDHAIDTLNAQENDRVSKEIHQLQVDNQRIIDAFPDIRSYVAFLKKNVQRLRKEHPSIPEGYLNKLFRQFAVRKFRFQEFSYPETGDLTWISHGNKGIFSCRNSFDASEKATAYLTNKNISYFFIDREGNYWFTSHGEGVFFLSAHGIKNYRSESDTPEIYSITGNRTHIISGKNNEVLFLEKATGEKFTLRLSSISTSSVYNRVRDLLLENSRLWVACDMGGSTFDFRNTWGFSNRTLLKKSIFSSPALKCLSRGAGGEIYVGTFISLLAIDRQFVEKKLTFKRITAVAEISPGNLLLGSVDGLHTYHEGNVTSYNNEDEAFRKSVTDIVIGKNGLQCVATSEVGLLLLKDQQYCRISSADSLPPHKRLASDICRKIFIDSSDHIWVCTNRGLSRVKVTSWKPLDYEVQQFTTDDGLLSNDVNDVYVDHDTVWIGTMSGLNMFRYDQIKRKGSLPLTYISNEDSINNRVFPFRTKITIGLQGISYESLGKIRYQYKLTGLDTEWQTTNRHEINYEVLPPGNYEFKAYSINRFGQQSAQAAVVSFAVLSPWWQTSWAYVSYSLSFAAVLLSTFYFVKRNLRMKEKARMRHQEQLQQLEMKALRSQMNPHFIFNTLNAIQKYILENDTDLSYRYLSKFSKLIRNFLENSRQPNITLQQELELLRSYMEMEALRFRNKFTYEIQLDAALDPDSINIPSMLIQPYVENAIWHGIQHKAGNGSVKISIRIVADGILKCSIEDNGIGRKMAREIAVRSDNWHQPVGMTITQQRLALINQRLKDTVNVNFIDLTDALSGKECGTIVEIIVIYSTKQQYEPESSNY